LQYAKKKLTTKLFLLLAGHPDIRINNVVSFASSAKQNEAIPNEL